MSLSPLSSPHPWEPSSLGALVCPCSLALAWPLTSLAFVLMFPGPGPGWLAFVKTQTRPKRRRLGRRRPLMMHVGVCGRLRVSACTPYTSHSTSADPQLPPQSFSFPLPPPSFFPHILHTSLLLLLLHLIRSSGPRAVGRRLSPGLRSHPRLRLRHRPGSGEELGPGLVHSGTGLRLHRHHRRPFIHAGGTCVGVGACVSVPLV